MLSSEMLRISHCADSNEHEQPQPLNHNEPRQDETSAVEISDVRKSRCIGKMEVPVQRGIDPSSHRSKLEAADNTRDREGVCGQKAVRCSDSLKRAGLLPRSIGRA